jgi:hypothetical protein
MGVSLCMAVIDASANVTNQLYELSYGIWHILLLVGIARNKQYNNFG